MFDFSNIDDAIKKFRKGKYGIYITEKARADWFTLQYRSIEWKKEHLIFKIEIFPDLDDEGNSVSWNYTAMIWFDENNYRHWIKYEFVKSSDFDVLGNNFKKNLEKNYAHLNSLKEKEIPFIIVPISQGL